MAFAWSCSFSSPGLLSSSSHLLKLLLPQQHLVVFHCFFLHILQALCSELCNFQHFWFLFHNCSWMCKFVNIDFRVECSLHRCFLSFCLLLLIRLFSMEWVLPHTLSLPWISLFNNITKVFFAFRISVSYEKIFSHFSLNF